MANRKRRKPQHYDLVGGGMGDNIIQTSAAQRDGNTITLSNGKVLTVDLHRVTMREYRSLFSTVTTPEEDDVIYARALGITADELIDLPQPDYRAACFAVIDIARKPLDNPNSASASTLG